MRYIRRFVYKIGRRPKKGSVLYSPSLAFLFSVRDVGKALNKKLK